MTTRRQIVATLATAACLSLFAAGCESTRHHSGAMGVMNSKCPLSGEVLPANCPTTDYKGGKVGFCCNGCAGKWGAMSAEKQAECFAKAK